MSATMDYTPELVLAVNEVWHDVEESAYQDRHPEIFRREDLHEQWRQAASAFRAGASGPVRVLDVGSGTGFVPLLFAPALRAGDVFVCSDLSANMLRVCERNLREASFACTFQFRKLDGQSLGIEPESVDCVTMSSVLHHVPDVTAFLADVGCVLRVGGTVIIAQEPNQPFYTHPFLWNNYRAVSAALRTANLRLLGQRIARRAGLARRSDSALSRYDRVVAEVNRRLLERGALPAPLSARQLAEILDVNSPTAGGGRNAGRGFDAFGLVRRYLPGFELDRVWTYSHLCKASGRNALTAGYDRLLRARFPTLGSKFMLVARKVSPSPAAASGADGAGAPPGEPFSH